MNIENEKVKQSIISFPLMSELAAERFRSLYDVQLSLKPLSIFIGPNAGGKSNLFKLLRFVRDIVVEDKWQPYDDMVDHLFWYGNDRQNVQPTQFSAEMQVKLPQQIGDEIPRYRLVARRASDKLGLYEESLQLRLSPDKEPVDFIDRQGDRVKHFVERVNGDYVVEDTRLSQRTAALREYGRAAMFEPVSAFYRFIEGWRFLDVDVRAARRSVVTSRQPDEVPPLAGDAGDHHI